MRIGLFLFYPGTIWNPGGGESLIRTTYTALKALGVDVEPIDLWRPKRYDIVHLFGSSYHVGDFVAAAKRTGARVVVTPCAYSVRPAWQWHLWGAVDRWLPVPSTYTVRRRLFEAADAVLPTSTPEAEQLMTHFRIPRSKVVVVPVACQERFCVASPELFVKTFGIEGFILMVARINRIKGQLRLMRALERAGVPLVFVGGCDPNDGAYYSRFQMECRKRSDVHDLGPIEHESELYASALAAARVHALVSTNEYPGIANLEAGLAGTNVVSLRSPIVYEYLGSMAYYCNPRSLTSIREAVLHAYASPFNGALRERLKSMVTPERVARKILDVYERLLSGQPCGMKASV
jgi:glycosyltransferase involved in cell wall biosynthesis